MIGSRITNCYKRITMCAESVSRLSVTIPTRLLKRLDAMVRRKGYANRSRAVADIVEAGLVAEESRRATGEIAGTITLVYDHHKRDLQARLTDIQHDLEGLVIAVLHVHLDHHHCMEVLAVQGRSDQIHQLADALATVKGVQHAKLTVTTTEREK